jgi:NADH dehydrogenase [ubiquinone] 1 alpha subcomplex assembly factor 5
MSNTSESQIFDRQLLRTRRQRRAREYSGFDFLKQEVAHRLDDRLRDVNRNFTTALDLGCHNGTMARLLEQHTSIDHVISADLSANMVAQAPGHRVVMDEEFLPFKTDSLNLITSVLSLHWVNDLPGALIQANMALKPDGLFLAAMYGGDTLTELRQALLQAELQEMGGASPRVSPFVDVRDAGNLLQRAGFALSVADVERITVDYSDALSLLRDLRGMGESNALLGRHRAPMTRKTMIAMAEAYHDLFGRPDGRITASFDIVFLLGWAPHESQQQPLKPGSGKVNLGDAIKMFSGDLQDPSKMDPTNQD